MSSHQDPYYYSDSSPNCYESGSESPVAQQLQPSGESWSPNATNDNRNDYSQPHQSSDPVANLLEVHDAEDACYSNYTDPSYPLSSTSLQVPGVGTNATHTTHTNVEPLLPLDLHSLMIPLNIQDDIPYHPFANLPFYPYPEFDHGHSQHQLGYTPHSPVHYHTQPLVHDAHQYPAQDIHNSQRSQDLTAHTYPGSSSTQLLSTSYGGSVHWADTRSARPTPDSSTQDGVNTARTADAGQHSHQFPVANSPSNQTSAPGPSRTRPTSSEKKRLLPLTATDEHTTARRVVPRHDRASGVHSTSSHPPRPGPSSREVYGRGPLIPQERYITSTISSYSAPDQHSSITFDLENPDQIGIPIIDILNKTAGFARIRDRTQAFSQQGKKTFTLRVQWPGYRLWSKTIAALDWTKSRAPITRVKVAEAVATAIQGLFEKYRDKPYDPYHAEWNVGPNGIQLNQICLVSLHHVSRGSWQPQFCLLEPLH